MIYLGLGVSNICSTAASAASATVIFQATSARRITSDIDDPPIIVHCILLRGRGKIATSRKVEYLGFGITNKILSRAR